MFTKFQSQNIKKEAKKNVHEFRICHLILDQNNEEKNPRKNKHLLLKKPKRNKQNPHDEIFFYTYKCYRSDCRIKYKRTQQSKRALYSLNGSIVQLD